MPSVSSTSASSATQPNSPSSDQVEGRNKNLKVPAQKAEKRIWNFQNRWYDEYKWLHYDEQLNRVLCFVCAEAKSAGLFSNSMKTEEAFTSVGYCNWRRGNENLRKHDISQQHKEAVRKLLLLKKSPISVQLSSVTLKKQEQARIALRSMFTSIIYLAKQGLPLRGSDHDGGNFIELLNLRSEDYRREKPLTSWDIQNEILKTISHFILRRIVAIVKSARLYSLVVDETSDCSVKEQVSISVRIVNEKLESEEYFLGHYETSSTTGEVLEKIIVDGLQRFGFSLSDLRGQCYDGASNMSGKFNGVQARLLKLQPKAIYVHCLSHSLNLALQSVASKHPFFRDLLSCVHEVGTILHGSPKRMGEFESKLENTSSNFIKPRPLCPTRWTVRVKSIEGLLNTYDASLQFLEDLGNSKEKISSKAAGLHTLMEKGEFFLGLLMAKNLFYIGECLSKVLQDPSATVSGGIEAATISVKRLQGLKSDGRFEKLWESMNEKIQECALDEPKLPRNRNRAKASDSTKDFSSPKERLQVCVKRLDVDLINPVLQCMKSWRLLY
ncbi:Zinc finger MYM-type protein 1 [Orchesella cincta]|uniref:Zinc finger MYM-type protein 1 n=1 Tax=Orchesella cincta TaxID=48709 RepID=A0A1D2MCH4_ORCCI|nr:Zinc finger MYM-type protein 1 [Orchesella cincta]